MSFSACLLDALREMGLSQSEFAVAVGSSKSHITDVIKERRTPPLDRIEQWADVLRLTGIEREVFLYEAGLAHSPPEMASRFRSAMCAGMADRAVEVLQALTPAELARLPDVLRREVEQALAGGPAVMRRSATSLAFRVSGVLFDPGPGRGPLVRLRSGWVEGVAPAASGSTGDAAEVVRLRAELTAAQTREQALTAEVAQLKDDLVALGRQLADQRRQAESLLDRFETIAAGRAHRDDVPRMNRMVPQTSTSDVAARAEAEAALLRQALAEEPAPNVAFVPRPAAPSPTRD